MKRQTSNARQEYAYSEPQQVKLNSLQQPIAEYINLLKTQIRHIGAQIDFQFERSSEFIFSLYKHFYSPTQCPGEKATFLNKLSNCGVQWGLQSVFDQKTQELEGPSQEGRSVNQIPAQNKEQENSKRAYNIRAKTRPQKHRYMEEEYDYGDKNPKADGPRRGRPIVKKDQEGDSRRDMTNPYQKAPYKRRRLPPDQEPNQENIAREEGAKSSVSEDDKEEQNERLKDNQEDRDENQKQAENVRAIKQADYQNKSPAKIGSKGEVGEGEGQHISALVQNYRKSWNFYKLLLELERTPDV